MLTAAERWCSPAAESGSEARADAVGSQVQRFVRRAPGKRLQPCPQTSSPCLPWCARKIYPDPVTPVFLTLVLLRAWNDWEQGVGYPISARVNGGRAAEHGGGAIVRVYMQEGS